MNKRTPLYDEHLKLKGKIVEFAGWQLPVQFSGIIEEHQRVRSDVGIFDVSHLGRIEVSGESAQPFLNRIITNDISNLEIGKIRYSLICNEQGGIIDDILVYRLPKYFLVIVNAINTDKVYELLLYYGQIENVFISNLTPHTAMISVQGPKAISVLQPITTADLSLSAFPHYTVTATTVAGLNVLLSRTGYTGADGFELIIVGEKAPELWKKILAAGTSSNILPCGLGARDTLRLEAGNLLYGQDMDLTTNPYEAGLGFAVKLDKPEFIGRQKLIELHQKGVSRKLVGFKMMDAAIPRHGYQIYKSNREIGKVTSGSYIPSLKCGIGLGYIAHEYTQLDVQIEIKIRDTLHPAKIVKKKHV
ncbi:MAG: glycine cleavage system aminomethyltransferase GcvT [bacterium]|nr:glycine cleavage system aminomethyltransferase GcvT [bacterium]